MNYTMLDAYGPIDYDEMYTSGGEIRPHWKTLIQAIESMGPDQLAAKQKEIDWRLEDNGVTYNVYDDPSGTNRPWKLDPIPMVIAQDDWNQITLGVQQRAKLLNLIFKDIYGEQKLLKEQIIPPEVIYAHSGFMREAHHLYEAVDFPLMMYALDLARGPDEKMWVIHDRTQSPSGLGYTIENRLTMNSSMGGLYSDISIRRLYTFIENFKSMLSCLSMEKNEPLNVLLTPGPHNETYFEHAYLSSFLGLTLVQGQDLLARGGAVWLKSLKGLRRVDTILRRVDERYCDPLELKADSKLGVSGLMHAVRKGGVNIVNPLGSGILENLGLHPFMPQLARYFLDEELILPQIATWWCGQDKERAFVLDNMKHLIVKKIDQSEGDPIFIGKNLSFEEIDSLRQEIMAHPYRYVAQEEIHFATAPTFVEGKLQPRKVVLRSFAIAKGGEYQVMPGGLVRVGTDNDALVVSSQSGGSSKDLWILGEGIETVPLNVFRPRSTFENSLENIPSLRAENFFWLGRYLMRSISNARMIRITLKSLANATRYDRQGNSQVQDILCKTLTHMSMTYPGFLGESAIADPRAEIWSVIADEERIGSLSQVMNMLSNANTSTKNLLTLESWRIFDRLIRDWKQFCSQPEPTNQIMIFGLDNLLVQLMAYQALIQDSLFEEQGLTLYTIGAGIERSQLLISKARAMLTQVYEPFTEYEVLETLLSSGESLNAYRAHYRTSIELPSVTEFLILERKFPKSLISEIVRLLKELPRLPKYKHHIYLSQYEEPLFEAFSLLRLSRVENLCFRPANIFVREILDTLLSEVADRLIMASDELSKSYFAHNDE